ncbi:MAG: hypothetical protein JXA89_06185 [Anaerolineae bacterium]|nr:hypothetical protein [Anaerolineae bacterium]
MSHPLYIRQALTGPWRVTSEAEIVKPMLPYTVSTFDDGDWREIPPATHIQPWLYPDNPYWGERVRAVNDSAWWYRTCFTRDELPTNSQWPLAASRFRLYFEAVDYYAEVWLNGQRLGEHEGGFVPFWFDVTGLLQDDNVLVVKVTAPWDPVRRKGLTYADEVYRGMVKGLYAHADGLIPKDVNPIGIWRPVWLEVHGDVTIERVPFAVAEDEYDKSAHVTLRLHIHSRRDEAVSNGVLHVYLAGETMPGLRVDNNFAVELLPGQSVVEQTVRISDPHWWWPWDMGNPDLYRIRCTLYDGDGTKLDVHEQVIGIRQTRMMRSKETMHYQINKQPIFVRGTTYMGGLYLSRLTREQIQADLDRVQECGLHLIRLHVHVAPPELYEECDRRGIMIWQDFELNWVHAFTPEFEERAVRVLHEMVDQLENHCSIVTWCCHNEPNALSFQDRNLTMHPDPRLYRELRDRDPSRSIFISSGRSEADWMRSGDSHAYIGGGHGGHYAGVYGRRYKMVTEFGCEAPPNEDTLDETPLLSERLAHLRDRIHDLEAYQAALVKYQIEWYRRSRFDPCGGYIHFMFVDLYPQVGCGALDAKRRPRLSFAALKAASPPVHVMMEYTAAGPIAIWVANDLSRPLLRSLIEWEVTDETRTIVTRGSAQNDIPAQRTHRVAQLSWRLDLDRQYKVVLRLRHKGQILDENTYDDPFHFLPRPEHFPWHFDPVLGMRCFGGPHAVSSLNVLNRWTGRLARLIFPVYDWGEQMLLENKSNPRMDALLRRVFG